MLIKLTSLMVDDQDKALKFYTEILGFVKKRDIPTGGQYRWISIVSPEGPDDLELSLEPNANPAGKVFQQAMLAQGIPVAMFQSSDIHAEYARLKGRGVAFRGEPVKMGPVTLVKFEDTCGNLIQMFQPG
jgi:catechol 2,3-dioxygenase-like lactoylglutathione lyase family enzyme